MTEVKTESGFVCQVDDERIADNYELLELLVQLDEGSRFVLPKVLEIVLETPEQIQALKDHVRGKNGKVSTTAIHKELLEIFKSKNSTKN